MDQLSRDSVAPQERQYGITVCHTVPTEHLSRDSMTHCNFILSLLSSSNHLQIRTLAWGLVWFVLVGTLGHIAL